MQLKSKSDKRHKRKQKTRAKVRGTALKPRICVYKSNSNLYAQLIDDEKMVTLCSISTIDKDVNLKGQCNKKVAVTLGEKFGVKVLAKNIKTAVFDRNGYPYHGIIKEFADACRKAGLEF
jgi:large subunit ribosomal protein L18